MLRLEKFVVSGSYDKTIKVRDRQSRTLVSDIMGRISFVKNFVSWGYVFLIAAISVVDGYLVADIHVGFHP